jgi:hypothetical protein
MSPLRGSSVYNVYNIYIDYALFFCGSDQGDTFGLHASPQAAMDRCKRLGVLTTAERVICERSDDDAGNSADNPK